jgi:hypothetical protein
MSVLVATDFFTTEVWTTAGVVTDYILFFIHLASRKIVTDHGVCWVSLVSLPTLFC